MRKRIDEKEGILVKNGSISVVVNRRVDMGLGREEGKVKSGKCGSRLCEQIDFFQLFMYARHRYE